MLTTLITSKTRIKLLLKFFLNSKNRSYLKHLEAEFEDSSNGIRLELNRFESAGLLMSENVGNKKMYSANTLHPMYEDIHNILLKFTGIDKLIESVFERLGNIHKVYLVGTLADGIDSNIIDIVIVGSINQAYLISLLKKVEPIVMKKIRYIVYSRAEFAKTKEDAIGENHLLIWGID